MSREAYAPLPLETWQALVLQLVTFPEQSEVLTQREWWEELTGAPADSSVRKRTEREDGGQYEGVQLVLTIDPLRLQWSAAAPIDLDRLGEQAPLLGPFPERRDWFLALMTPWLAQRSPPVKRLAFAATLFQRVPDLADGYRRLDQYLRHVEVSPASTDFMFRVNRKKATQTGIANLEINRLTTWAVVKVVTEVSARLLGAPAVSSAGRQEEFYLSLSLDVNTIHEFPNPTLPQDRLGDILAELAEFATELARRGDNREDAL